MKIEKLRNWLMKIGVYALFIFISIKLMELYAKKPIPFTWKTGDRESWFATKIQIVGFGILLPFIAVLHGLFLLLPLIFLVLVVRRLRRSDIAFALFAAACALLLPMIFWIRSMYTGANPKDVPMIVSVSWYIESMYLLAAVICLIRSWWAVWHENNSPEGTIVPWISTILVLIGFATWGVFLFKGAF